MKKCYLIVTIFLISIFTNAFGDERALKINDFSSEKRVALIIGNSDYKFNPLKNPGNDAEDIASELKKLGFDVILKKNVDRREMATSIKEFGKKIRNGGVGLFYFAGHGVQIQGENYLIPLNETIETEEDVEFEAIQAGRVLAEMKRAGNKMNIIILDACRNNPFETSSRSGTRGLARMDAPTGSLLVYSTSPGKTALDGENARNGVFTESLLSELRNNPHVNINDLLINVRSRVIRKTDNSQIPWESSSLTGKFYFARSTTDEYDSFKAETVNGLKEFKAKESNLKELIKKRAEYRIQMEEEFKSIVAMESDEYITPEEKVILWQDYLEVYKEDNPHVDEVNEKIAFWQDYEHIEKDDFVAKKGGETFFFEDYFVDNRNNWYEIASDDTEMEVQGDGYLIYNKNYFQKVVKDNMVDLDSDYVLETSISKLDGFNNNGLNILFGGENGGNRYYIFGTTGTGYYGVFKYENGWNDVLSWKQSDYVNKDDATNNLRIEKKGNTLYFYINDNYIDKVDNFEAYGPAVGFAINPDIRAKIRYLLVTSDQTEILLEDNFVNNNNYWPEEKTSTKTLNISNGYIIYNKDYFQKSWMNNVTDGQENLEIEVELQKLSGRENNAINVIFGSDAEASNYLAFGVSGDGQYLVSSYTGQWNIHINWTASKHIRTGSGLNTLKVIKEGTMYYFYINGQYVNEVEIPGWYGDSVGFGVNSGIEAKIKRVKVVANLGYYFDDLVIMNDEFNNNSNKWIERDEEGVTLKIKNGEYEVFNKDQYFKTWQRNLFLNTDENFEIESEMKRNSGTENNIYGILFGMNDDASKFYQFGVSSNGYYAVFKYDGNWISEIGWTQSSYVNSGTEANIMRVRREGKNVEFFINDNYIGKIDNFESFGLATGIGVASNMNVRVENFKVSLLDY